MSEFKFACPVCGQHICCDSAQNGTIMDCPTCFQKITAPQAPASDHSKLIITGTKAGELPAPSAAPTGSRKVSPEMDSPKAVIVFVVVLLVLAGTVAIAFHAKSPPLSPPASSITNGTK